MCCVCCVFLVLGRVILFFLFVGSCLFVFLALSFFACDNMLCVCFAVVVLCVSAVF